MNTMHPLSDEQRAILVHVQNGDNVAVDACAGSGKSSTILSTAHALEDKQFLQMTYNSMLRFEVKEKIRHFAMKNIQVHTYHSLAVKYYLSSAHTDTGIRYILERDLQPVTPLPRFDVIVLDEAQDMTHVYYDLMMKLIKDMYQEHKHPIQILVMGDYMQGLYEFKGADIRFLTKADEIWSCHPHLSTPQFHKCTLRMSYRITNQMANFVNHVMLGEPRLLACRDGSPVTYIRNTRSNIERIVVYQITRLLAEGESPSDIFVLGASVKGPNSNIRKMENALSERDIPCHVPMLETDKIDERVIDGKVVFSTFHCVKGRQRKYVFVVGFDNTYLTFYARTLPRTVCPNTLYVGCTRATHGLYLMENDQWSTDRPLEFLRKTHHEMKQCEYVDFKGIPRSLFYEKPDTVGTMNPNTLPTHYVTPTDLIKFIPESVVEEVTPILDRIFLGRLSEKEEDLHLRPREIDIPTMTKTARGFHEDVSDLNGIAIPSLYYDDIGGGIGTRVLLEMIDSQVGEMKPNQHAYLREIVKDLPRECTTADEYLYLANVYVAVQEKLYFKLKQIDREEYNWLTNETIIQCRERIDEAVGLECALGVPKIEHLLIHHSMEYEHRLIDQELSKYLPMDARYRFSARVDLLTFATLWELKCTSKITIDHMLQVVLYAWLYKMVYPDEMALDTKILNIKTGEILRLDATMEELTQIVVALLRGKYGEPIVLDDDDFLAACHKHNKR